MRFRSLLLRSFGLSGALVAGMVVMVAVMGPVAMISVFVVVVPPVLAAPAYGVASGWVDAGAGASARGTQATAALGGVALTLFPFLVLNLVGWAVDPAGSTSLVGVAAYFVWIAACWLVTLLVLALPTAWMVGALRRRGPRAVE